MYGDACSADRQAQVGSGRQLAGSCLIELSRLDCISRGGHQLKTNSRPTKRLQAGETFTAEAVQSCVTPCSLWWLLYIVFYDAFERRADSLSSLMNKEKQRSDGPVSLSIIFYWLFKMTLQIKALAKIKQLSLRAFNSWQMSFWQATECDCSLWNLSPQVLWLDRQVDDKYGTPRIEN